MLLMMLMMLMMLVMMPLEVRVVMMMMMMMSVPSVEATVGRQVCRPRDGLVVCSSCSRDRPIRVGGRSQVRGCCGGLAVCA